MRSRLYELLGSLTKSLVAVFTKLDAGFSIPLQFYKEDYLSNNLEMNSYQSGPQNLLLVKVRKLEK